MGDTKPDRLTHADETGAARMVDVGDKPASRRQATARCRVRMAAATVDLVRANQLRKGDALSVARVAGIMAAKRTHELVPLCHPLPISSVDVDFELLDDSIVVLVTARVTGPTGVEMEALTGAAVAGLTLIDMVKGVERGVSIEEVALLAKSGGRSGDWRRPQ